MADCKDFFKKRKKQLHYGQRFAIIALLQRFGQLAQLVEHLLDVQGVRGSSPLLSTIYKAPKLLWFRGFFIFR